MSALGAPAIPSTDRADYPGPESAPDLGTDTGDGISPPVGAFQALLADARRRRERDAELTERTSDSSGSEVEWCEPDPQALTRLPTWEHPITRTVERHAGKNQIESALRRAYAFFRGIDPGQASWTHVLEYPWHQITPEQAASYHRHVRRRYSNQGSRNNNVHALRAVLLDCYRARTISALRHDRLTDELTTVAHGRSRRRRRLSVDEFERLITAAETTGNAWARARNTAIIATFRTTGIRVSELVGLDLADWDQDQDTLFLGKTKNLRPHTVFVHPEAKPYLLRWLTLRGGQPGPLFMSSRKKRPLLERRLHPKAVNGMVTRRSADAGIPHLTCHDFRRNFASDLLNEFDPVLVSHLLNHKSLASTIIYDVRGEEMQRSAVSTLAMPGLDRITPGSDPSPGGDTHALHPALGSSPRRTGHGAEGGAA
ncbi:tyrosine-type recombinase/integrase [Nocardioides caldifontis]|uniref:tyrosine-type recombinase/integrase n=1 Tax=Nocardioides caldifontis TaxID=2588938 RepID=UPI001396986E|nr:site-specific integrase [Nocardioides caldifontis]